jgi:molybdate transport system substrate-binding protein
MYFMRSLLITLLLSLCLVSSALATEVRLSIALGMRDAFNEIAAAYEKKQPDVTLLINYAAAGVLAKQIVQGAPADIFVSANHHWMNYLVAKQCVPADQIHIFAYNSLVFVGRKNASVNTLSDVVRLERIALGSPKSVPVGEYAKQALQAAGLYEKVQNKLVLAKDVRQALLYADRGEADGAFVYRTDALLAKTAVVLLEVPQSLYDKVTFVVAPTTSGLSSPQALAFFDFLQTGQANEILEKYGYVIP